MVNPLDHPVWAALRGPHRVFGRWEGLVGGYPPEVCPFAALGPDPDASRWRDLAAYAGPGGAVVVAGLPADPPSGWTLDFDIPVTQLLAPPPGTHRPPAPHDAEISELSAADVPEMLDLVERTKPGPFRARTIEMGRYLGIRRAGELIAMAGERVRPPGATEISAVCTDPEHRGQGLAAHLVTAVVEGIRSRGETPFLHVADVNTAALSLYERMGFRRRRTNRFAGLTAPS